ncbi:universal stress protein [Rhodococcus qingshengii]|uniref:universal stress protein n=1 Tax=Rhodococcus qingshengii TaxID=334542 RepID=UPI00352FDF48
MEDSSAGSSWRSPVSSWPAGAARAERPDTRCSHDPSPATVFRSDPDGVSLDWDTISTAEHAVLAERLGGWREEYPDVAVRCVVVRDNPARQLEIESKSAQLVLVGRRGRGGFSSMLLGSTSRRLIHTVSCPLLIVSSPTRQKDQNK